MRGAKPTWEPPTLANIKWVEILHMTSQKHTDDRQQEVWLRMQAKSAPGRERAVEHIINEGYIKQLLNVFEQAEDLEALDDLHALCSLIQTIRTCSCLSHRTHTHCSHVQRQHSARVHPAR